MNACPSSIAFTLAAITSLGLTLGAAGCSSAPVEHTEKAEKGAEALRCDPTVDDCGGGDPSGGPTCSPGITLDSSNLFYQGMIDLGCGIYTSFVSMAAADRAYFETRCPTYNYATVWCPLANSWTYSSVIGLASCWSQTSPYLSYTRTTGSCGGTFTDWTFIDFDPTCGGAGCTSCAGSACYQ